MTTQIDPLTGFSPFKSIVAPLNSNDLLDAILYRSNSIADPSIESITSSKKQTNSNKSVALKSTDNQFQTNTQSVLLSNANNLSVSSLQPIALNAISTTKSVTVATVGTVSPAAAVVSKLRVEAESITNLSVFRLESIAAASGGKVLSFKDGVSTSEVGTATFKFTGVDGYYDVILGAFDENDGQARFEMTKNGTAIGAVILNQQLGSADAIVSTAVARTISTKLQIKNGDTFSVKGFENAGEKARFDYIDFLPVVVVPVNTLPVANNDSATTNQNQAVTLLSSNLLANDTDADKDILTLSSVKNAVNGSVALNASGNPVFTPTSNFSGNASFDYVVSDGKGGTAAAKVNLLVNAITPNKLRVEAESIANLSVFRLESVAAASGGKVLSFKDGVSTSEVGTATFQFTGIDGYYDVILGAFDENDGQARFEMTKNGTAIGAVTLNQQLGSMDAIASTAVARTISTKLQIKNGDTFSIKGFENTGEKARFDYIDFIPATTSVNTAPVANGDSATTQKNQAITLLATNLLANDTDADGDKLTLSSVKSSVNGSVVLNASGNPVFTPTADFSGNSSFDYVISDGKGGTATATVKVLVTNPAIALPDLVTKFAPKSNPALPTGKDIFAPSFVVNDAGNSSRPAITEWTRTGKAGDTIVLTGWQLDASTKFFVYGQTNGTNGALLEAKIQKLDGNVAAITLPTALPQGSDYLLWAQNSSGYSQPVMINQTEAWWVKETSSRGQIASVFGRNLSQDGGTQNSQVYLEDSAGKGYWAQVVGVNPYKVDFKVPDALANGDYQVFVHNGDGGQYGWSKPLTMTIDNGLNYTGAVFNVKNYGAKGDGVTNDTAAINAARAAADKTPWSTVYLPTGTYVVNQALDPGRDQVRWLGDGKNLTNIKVANGSSQQFLFLNDAFAAKQITFQDLTLDANAKNAPSMQITSLMRNTSDLQYVNVRINGEGTAPLDWHLGYNISMKNSDIIGKENFLGTARQVFIDGSNFYGAGNTSSLIIGRGIQNISITNSTGQNLDISDPKKYVLGRFFVDQGNWSPSINQYLGYNKTINLAPSPDSNDQNCGEQILWEQGEGFSTFLGKATASTVNTVTVSVPSSTVNGIYKITIVGGKGIGQTRLVQSLNQSTYTIKDNWNVQPDSSSVIVANKNIDNAVVYGNSLDGLSDYKTRQTASAGVQTYFGASNLIVDNNTFNQIRFGIRLCPGGGITENNPINFTQVSNNTFTNDFIGIDVPTSGQKGTALLGTSIRNNNFNNVGNVFSIFPGTDSGINPLPIANMNVFENNTLGTGGVSIDQGNGNIQNTIFLNNTSLNGPLNPGVVSGNFSF